MTMLIYDRGQVGSGLLHANDLSTPLLIRLIQFCEHRTLQCRTDKIPRASVKIDGRLNPTLEV